MASFCNLFLLKQFIWCLSVCKGKVKRTCIAPFVKLQLKVLRYGSHRVGPANYTILASTLRTFVTNDLCDYDNMLLLEMSYSSVRSVSIATLRCN